MASSMSEWKRTCRGDADHDKDIDDYDDGDNDDDGDDHDEDDNNDDDDGDDDDYHHHDADDDHDDRSPQLIKSQCEHFPQ